MNNQKKNSKRAWSKENKTFDRGEGSISKGSGFCSNFSTLGISKHASSHSKKIKYKNMTKAHQKPNIGLMSNSNTYDVSTRKPTIVNHMCSDTSKKVISRTAGLNKSDYKPSTTKKRWISGVKIAGNSRNKSTYLGDSQADPSKKASKISFKYKNLSFYNNPTNDKKKKAVNLLVPWMVSNYANNIISKPILLKKNIVNANNLNVSKFEETRTRNPGGIFNTNETVPYHLINESYLQMKSTDRKNDLFNALFGYFS